MRGGEQKKGAGCVVGWEMTDCRFMEPFQTVSHFKPHADTRTPGPRLLRTCWTVNNLTAGFVITHNDRKTLPTARSRIGIGGFGEPR